MKAYPYLSVLLAARALVWAGSGADALASSSVPQAERRQQERQAETKMFAYKDEELLFPWQHQSSAVYTPAPVEPGARVPLIVFLHGINGEGVSHLWMGGGNRDLRPHFEELSRGVPGGLVFAVPGQSRNASLGSRLWTHFDLASFVEATQEALGERARLDTSRVLVVGHSGAGCNPDGGVVSIARGAMKPLAIIPVDTCLDGDLGKALAERPAQERLWVFWQDRSWPRQPQAFQQAVEEHQAPGAWFRMDRIETEERNPHEAILPIALKRVIPALLEKSAP